MMNEEEKTARYEVAVEIVKRDARDDKVAEAKAVFEELGDFRESKAYAKHCERYLSFKVGQTVTMGEFEGKPLEWIVLEKKGRSVFLYAKDIITKLPWHTMRDYTTWSECSLRRWLNKDFINSAFTLKERMTILLSECDNGSDPRWGADNGPNTRDKLFVFSKAELDEYFPKEEDRAIGEWYWLRGHGDCLLALQAVYKDGSVYMVGVNKNSEEVGVRPAMRLRLD